MKQLVISILLFGILAGCWYDYPRSQYRPINMSMIAVGMSEDEVRMALGEPADVIGARYYKGDHVVKVLQYMEAEFSYTGDHDRLKKNYYLYFLDDKLVQWGRPGDWAREADSIYEIRFR